MTQRSGVEKEEDVEKIKTKGRKKRLEADERRRKKKKL